MNKWVPLAVLLWCGSVFAKTGDDVYASYVVLGQHQGQNIAFARVILPAGTECPTLSETMSANGNDIAMVTRDNPYHFPVIVCEAEVAFDTQYHVNTASMPILLPEVVSKPQHIQVFGDTGCDPFSATTMTGCQPGTAAEPFQTMAKVGASQAPDLVLHMGDYNYRGTSGKTYFTESSGGKVSQVHNWVYDAGDGVSLGNQCGQADGTFYYSQSATNSNKPDTWEHWYSDLFLPAKDLLAAAPWIVARGNHELCSRAGPGYFYFLDPHSNLAGGQQLSCPAVDTSKSVMQNSLQIPNYLIDFSNIDIAVIDSANACDDSAQSPFSPLFVQAFADLAQRVKSDSWLVTHRPIWGVNEYDTSRDTTTGCTSADKLACINQMMQAAIKTQPSQALPTEIKAIFTGHMHKFESVSFPGTSRPSNIIVGSSGVSLSNSPPYGTAKVPIDGMQADVLSLSQNISYQGNAALAFGFLNISVTYADQWQGSLYNPALAKDIVQCSDQGTGASCNAIAGLSVVSP